MNLIRSSAAALVLNALAPSAQAAKVSVRWANFQQERWKDSRELGQKAAAVASALAAGKPVAGAQEWSGGAKQQVLDALLLTPVPVTRANLDVVVKAGWIGRAELCRGASAAGAPPACR